MHCVGLQLVSNKNQIDKGDKSLIKSAITWATLSGSSRNIF